MRALPTAEYPDKRGVTLKCTRAQEAVSCPLPGFFFQLNLFLVGVL